MARFRVTCGGCGFTDVVDDETPPADVSAEQWDAESAAKEVRDTHQLSEGHSVNIERVE